MITLGQMAARLSAATGLTDVAVNESVKRSCEIIVDEAKDAIGTYKFGWPQLAPSTQAQRVRLGYPANEPLLRTGELRDSISYTVDGSVGYVFSTSPVAVWMELGTVRIPPRPFLAGAADAKRREVEEALQMGVVSGLISALKNQPGRWFRHALRGEPNPPQAARLSLPVARRLSR